MLESAAALVEEYAELERRMSAPDVAADLDRLRELTKRYAALGPTVAAYHAWTPRPATSRPHASSPRRTPRSPRRSPRSKRWPTSPQDKLRRLLVPRDPDDDKDVILEVKAGEGGEESALFAGDLLRMYLRYAERRGWRTEVLDATESDLGGYKDVQVRVMSPGRPPPGRAPGPG